MRATAMEAKTFRLKPVLVEECVGDRRSLSPSLPPPSLPAFLSPLCVSVRMSVVGDRSAAAHVFSKADIAARFGDITTLSETLEYLRGLE